MVPKICTLREVCSSLQNQPFAIRPYQTVVYHHSWTQDQVLPIRSNRSCFKCIQIYLFISYGNSFSLDSQNRTHCQKYSNLMSSSCGSWDLCSFVNIPNFKGPLGSSVKISAHNILPGCFLVPLKTGRKIQTSGIRENIPVPSEEKLTGENYGRQQRTKWSFLEIFWRGNLTPVLIKIQRTKRGLMFL
jgi:hypothetical protein